MKLVQSYAAFGDFRLASLAVGATMRVGPAMQRRTFLGNCGGRCRACWRRRVWHAAPAASTLKFVPAQDLTLLDPIQSPSGSTIMHSCLVFDTLYGLDENYKAQPQMVEGHVIEDDGKTWKLTLRDGLKFHNGEPVRARDAVASLQRWASAIHLARRCSRSPTNCRHHRTRSCSSG